MGLGRLLIILGIVLIVSGILLSYTQFFSFINLGRLPGDIRIQTGNVTIFFPLATMILLSVILTILLNIIGRVIRK